MIYAVEEKCLQFLNSLLSKKKTRDIIEYQYCIKSKKSNSWVIYIRQILAKYNLPSIFHLLHNSTTRKEWKTTVKEAIDIKRKEEIVNEANSKSTLNFLNTTYQTKKLHPCVAQLESVREVRRTQLFVRLVTGTYTVQSLKYKFKTVPTPMCQLCKQEDEDIPHLLIKCPATATARFKYLGQLQNAVPCIYIRYNTLFKDTLLLTQLLVDPTHPRITACLDTLQPAIVYNLLKIAKNLLYAIHILRNRILDS